VGLPPVKREKVPKTGEDDRASGTPGNDLF
jgi:hypothetical protein